VGRYRKIRRYRVLHRSDSDSGVYQDGEHLPLARNLSSLRLLGTVGEPINPEAWMWYYHVIGSDRCPIVDTWWQTETGGIMITPLPGAISRNLLLNPSLGF